MFGLEDESKKKGSGFRFDLENDLKDAEKASEIKESIRKRMQEVKTTLRQGENQETFDRLGTLLHGYVSLLKIISRVEQQQTG